MAAPKQSAKKVQPKTPVAKRPATKSGASKKTVARATTKKNAAKTSAAKTSAAKLPKTSAVKTRAAAPGGARNPGLGVRAKASSDRRVPAKRGAAARVASKNVVARGSAKNAGTTRSSKASPGKASPVVTESSRARRDGMTPAREARQLLEQRKAIKTALTPVGDGKTIVDAYMRDVDHPFKAEMEAVRQIILGVSPKLSERIKWNAPSFYYKEDLGAFNPRATEFAHLILLFPGGGALPEKSSILEGAHKDRREVKFHGMDDVKAKQRALEKIVKAWVALRDS